MRRCQAYTAPQNDAVEQLSTLDAHADVPPESDSAPPPHQDSSTGVLIASITKTFTATMLFKLRDEGKRSIVGLPAGRSTRAACT